MPESWAWQTQRAVQAGCPTRPGSIRAGRLGPNPSSSPFIGDSGTAKPTCSPDSKIRISNPNALSSLGTTESSKLKTRLMPRFRIDCLLLLRGHVDKGHRPAGDIGHIAIPLLNCLPLHQG